MRGVGGGRLGETLRWLVGLRPRPVTTPYSHVVQLGDPVLRARALPVAAEELASAHVRHVIDTLVRTLRRYRCVGMAAPQIGVPLRIIAVEVTAGHLAAHPEAVVRARHMQVTPLTVLVNPQLTVDDYVTGEEREMCASLRSLSGLVPRYRSVTVTGVSPAGEPVRWSVSDWTARIVQHEMDHLAGTVFTDRCAVRSLETTHWQTVNRRAGRFQLSYDGFKNRQ